MISTDDSNDFEQKLSESKVAVIGAGGIGCELLKNLALTGFKDVTVIDLDTIDISNLNRQFLFRKEHVGKSKAEVASAAVKQIAPDMRVTFHHDSIMSEKYGVDFYRQFALVMSALDNKAARSHVNRLCLVAGVPLIESGTAGYIGQVGVIIKGRTECFDCTEKSNQKTYPSCTIRNTPSEPIHCVVWAKSLFNQLFGESDPDDDVSPETVAEQQSNGNGGMNENGPSSDGASATNNGTMAAGSTDQQEGPKRLSTRQFAESMGYKPKQLFDKLFHDDINYLLSMADLWKERKKPVPVHFDELVTSGLGGSAAPATDPAIQWNIGRWAQVFEECTLELAARYQEGSKEGRLLAWDKDDDAAMQFVAACANLRAHIFHIGTKSLFDVKAMAGNIIPAIATTNACVAGMVVVEALKVLTGQLDKCRTTFISPKPNPAGKFLVDQEPNPPNPKCYVCATDGQVLVRVNLDQMLLKQFRQTILLGALNMLKPDVMDLCQNHNVLISSEEGETDAIMDRTLASLGVRNGTQVECDDFSQNLNFKMIIFHSAKLNGDEFEMDNFEQSEEEKKLAATGNGHVEESGSNNSNCQPLEESVQGMVVREQNVSMEVNLSSAADELKRKRYSSNSMLQMEEDANETVKPEEEVGGPSEPKRSRNQ